jgi:putative ABC transport system substrate-binding protein
MKRREFIAGLGAAAWPVMARAQAVPVVGYLAPGSSHSNAKRVGGLRQGLGEAGYVEGRNLAIECRWAYDQIDRLSD